MFYRTIIISVKLWLKDILLYYKGDVGCDNR